jgi:peroxiredoxin
LTRTLHTVVPVGALAPPLDLPTIDGDRFSLREEREHPVLVSFLRHAG